MVGRVLEPATARAVGVYLLTTTGEQYFATLGFAAVDRAAVPVEIRASPEFVSICPAAAIVMHRGTAAEGDAR